jgi:hypothetical protein
MAGFARLIRLTKTVRGDRLWRLIGQAQSDLMRTDTPPPANSAVSELAQDFSVGPQESLSRGPRDQSLVANLRRLQLLTTDWPGQPLDEFGSIRLLNPAATGQPVVWCFNAKHEFPPFAAAFSDTRPVVGMRSLNHIMPAGPTRHFPDEALANHYAAVLLRHFGSFSCIVGGNCQAAPVAHFLALALLAAGAKVERLVTVEAVIRRFYPGHMRLLFSNSSTRFNPFLTQAAPQVPWQHIYQSHDWQILTAAHGEFFRPGHVTELAQAICADSPITHGTPPPFGPWPLVWSRVSLGAQRAGGQLELTAPAPPNLTGSALEGLMLLAHWRSTEFGSWISLHDDRYLSPIQHMPGRGLFHTRLDLPPKPGNWTLAPVLCQRHRGPLTVPKVDHNVMQVNLV